MHDFNGATEKLSHPPHFQANLELICSKHSIFSIKCCFCVGIY